MNASNNNSQKWLVQDYFNKHAKNWQSIYSIKDLSSFLIQQRKDYVLGYVDSLNLKRGARILDAGCGAGLTSLELLKKGFVVVGIDVSKNMVDLARKNCAKVGLKGKATFQVGDVEALSFEDDSFDAVIGMGLIEYLKWDRWALQEIYRVLKPDGFLIVTVPNKIRLSYLLDPIYFFSLVKQETSSILKKVLEKIIIRTFGYRILRKLIYKLTHNRNSSKTPKTFKRNLYVPSRLKQMLSWLDFEILDSVSHGYGPFRLLKQSKGLSLKLNWILQKWSGKKIFSFLSDLGSDYIVLSKKKTLKINERQVFVPNKDVKIFEPAEKEEFLSRRNIWIRKNPEYFHLDLKQLNTRIYSRKNVLVISPHPDDEIIGCGGTLIKMLKEGSRVTILQLTDGSDTGSLRDCPEYIRKTVRLKEARVVAENLGIDELILWKEKSSNLKCTQANVRKLTDILNRLQPEVIFVPFINDVHPDHIIANEILRKALEDSNLNLIKVDILSYEVWSFVPPNIFCIIDNQFEKKTKMLMKYRTGMKVIDYVHFWEFLNAYHAHTLLGKKSFIEVFLNLYGKAYLKLVQDATRPK